MRHTLVKTLLLILVTGFPFFAQATPPDTIRTAIKVGVVKEYCVDTTEFSGMMSTIEDVCDASSGTAVNFVLIDNAFCLSYGGLELGTEASCLVYCDDLGQCDTTIFIVTIVHDSISTLPVIAVDDYLETIENTSVSENIFANDLLPNSGAYTSFQIITQGNNGEGVVDNEGNFTYTPDQDFCGSMDTFAYEICNIVSCDTAQIYITVGECLNIEGLFVYNGFSPNDDFINDSWKILGLEELPDHEIHVFNRWGNLVYKTKNYQNDWDGKWEGTPLAPGTYFYLIDDGLGKKHSGYIQISY